MIGETFKIDTAWQGINKVSFATACFPGHKHKLSTAGELIRCVYQAVDAGICSRLLRGQWCSLLQPARSERFATEAPALAEQYRIGAGINVIHPANK